MNETRGVIPGRRFWMGLLACLLLGVAAGRGGLISPRRVEAAAIVVNSSGDAINAGDSNCTLREAMTNASQDSDVSGGDCAAGTAATDTITFSSTVTLVSLGGSLPSVQGNTTVDGGGTVIIDGQDSVQPFNVSSGSSLTLENITITRGNSNVANGGAVSNAGNGTLTLTNVNISFSQTTGFAVGGAVFNSSQGTLIVTNSTISANHSVIGGGGIYNDGGSATLTNTTVSGNGSITGGGVFNLGTLVLDGSHVDGNHTGDQTDSCTTGTSPGLAGGGIYNDSGTLTIKNGSTVSQNAVFGPGDGGGIMNNGGDVSISDSEIGSNCTRSGRGGGIANIGGSVDVTNSTIVANQADNNGGGIYTEAANGASLTVFESTIRNNTTGFRGFAGSGGGIHNNGSVVHITDSTISTNAAPNGGGGGIYNSDARGAFVELINDTVAFNSSSASIDSGIHNDGLANVVTLTSTIVAENSPVDCANANETSNGHNLDSDGTCNLTQGTDNPSATADLGPLQDNGGGTFTHALGASSDAIDTGDNTVCTATYDPNNPGGASGPYDQRGSGFDRISGSSCDIGAFEVQQANHATVAVIKDFTDNSSKTVNVSLSCPSADSVTPSGSQTLGDGGEVDYDVSFSVASVTCTVFESSVAGYNAAVQCTEDNLPVGAVIGASYVIQSLEPEDLYVCTFTNSPITPPSQPTPTPSPTPTRTPTPTPTPTLQPAAGVTEDTLVCAASQSSPAPGSQVSIQCLLKDQFGRPEPSTSITLALTAQPGNDASIGSMVTQKVTDANGIATATLKAGSTPGMIVVDATSALAHARVIVNVQGGSSVQSTALPAATPASAVPVSAPSLITPPNTGSGGLR